MVYDDIKISYITIEHLFCKSDDLSTAYKVVIRHKGNLNTSDIKKIIIDINTLQTECKCKLKNVIIVGDSLDRRAYLFMKKYQKNKLVKILNFEFFDQAIPKRGLKLYFYVKGKIEYIGVDDVEYKKGDYFEISELKEDMYQLYPDVPGSELIPFYVRNWVIFNIVPSRVEEAYSEYLDVISELGEEKYHYIITIRPNGTKEYTKIQVDENENNLSD